MPDNTFFHYQPGAQEYARDVNALLPDAMSQVEAVHGRRFKHPVTVGVYLTWYGLNAPRGDRIDKPWILRGSALSPSEE